MNKLGWFLTGFYVLGFILSILSPYDNLGTVEQRMFIGIWSILAIVFNLIFLEDKKRKEKGK